MTKQRSNSQTLFLSQRHHFQAEMISNTTDTASAYHQQESLHMPNSAKGAHTSEQQAHQCPSMALCIAAPYEVLSHKIMEMDKEDLCSSSHNRQLTRTRVNQPSTLQQYPCHLAVIEDRISQKLV